MRVPFSEVVTRSVRSLVVARSNSTAAASQVKPTDWDSAKPFEEIPGPTTLPIIGNAWRFVPGIGNFANIEFSKLIEKFYKDHGNIVCFGGIPGRIPMILLFDPVDVEKVFRNEGAWPERVGLDSMKHYREATRKDFFEHAEGLAISQGEEWGKFRTIVNQPMMQPRVVKNYVAPIDEVAQDFVKRIPMLREPNGEMPAHFINELYKWALESITMIVLDTRLGCLGATLAPDSEPQQLINNVLFFFDCMFELDLRLPIWKLISTSTWRKYVKCSDFLLETSMKYVNIALERLESMPADSIRELSILERILTRDPNPKVACVIAMDMVTAGIEPTAQTIGFLLYHLAVNPEKQEKLHEELDRVLEKSPQAKITDDNMNNLKYLKACVRESMRMSPVAVGTNRVTNKDLVLQGYKIPKGTRIVTMHKTMSMLQKHFPNPDQFIPERWLKNDRGVHQKTNRFASMPFGFGTRSCAGQRFAELEIEVLVAKILQKYKVEWHHGPMITESKLHNTCKSPLRYKMIDRM